MIKTIYLAGGCFWGVQEYYSRLYGVIETTAGYANGTTAFPSYEDVKSGKTGHAETVKIEYDDEKISLDKLLEHYLRFVDPYSLNKQGEDEGVQYRTGVYYTDLNDAIAARNYFSSFLEPGYKIEIAKLNNFYKAEEYHQDYLKKNHDGYCHINLRMIKPVEKRKPTAVEIANACADIYETYELDEFAYMDSLVKKVMGERYCELSEQDLYDVLNAFCTLVNVRHIPMVMYKVPGPYNEPIYQSFRKIGYRCGYRYPTSTISFYEEISDELKKTLDERNENIKKMEEEESKPKDGKKKKLMIK